MDRYSIINGTTLAGPYDRMGISQGLPQFLSRIGANSMNFILSKVESLLCGFEKLEGYEVQPTDDKPLAIRYAPMHLYRLPELPNNMEPFCALAVSGPENRTGGRDSVYSQTFYLSRNAMHKKTDGYTYLDQIFGTTLITSREMDGHREGRAPIDLDAEPDHVTVEMLPQDRAVVLRVVHDIYNKKTVVIRLEKGCGFNRRSLSLLRQIYSMMQPRLAAEIGFATYHNPTTLHTLANLTSTRIFVIPQEVPLDRITLPEYTLVDLNEPESCKLPPSNDLLKQLQQWYKLPVADRLEALEVLFEDGTLDYTDKEKFLEISTAFWKDPLFVWLKEVPEQGTMSTLMEVLTKRQSFPLCRISWIGKMFDRRAGALLKEGLTLELLTAQGACEYALGEKVGKKKFAAGKTLLPEGTDVSLTACGLTKAAADKAADERYAAEIARLNGEIAKLNTAYEEETQRLKNALKAKLEEVNNHYKGLLDEKDQAHAAEKAQLIAQCQAEVAALQKQAQEAMARAEEAYRAKCAEYDLKIAQLRDEYAQAMARKDGVIAQKEQELSQAQAAHAEEVTALKGQLTQAQAETQAARKEAARIQSEAAAQVEAAEGEARKLEAELEETRRLSQLSPQQMHGEKRKVALFGAIAGVLAGAVLVGAIWLTTSLLGGKKEEPPKNPSTSQTTEGTENATPADTIPTGAAPAESTTPTEQTSATEGGETQP